MNYKNELLAIVGLALVVLLLVGCATSTPIPTATAVQATAMPTVAAPASPNELSNLNPSPRGYISMAYDSKADQAILFGGLTNNDLLPSSHNGETWAYNVGANRWTQMKPPSGPTVREYAEMAYDAKADRVILFGGAAVTGGNTVVLADTWAYDYNTNTWTEMANGPANYGWGSIVYDDKADRIILYGGTDSFYNFSPDTWAYDYNTNTWTDMKPRTSPPARNNQILVYDDKANRVIMWGGDTGWESGTAPKDESVWSYDYDTNKWKEIKPHGTELWPDCRDFAAAAYDSKSDRMIMSGGYYQVGTDETWAYDFKTNTWTKLEPNTAGGHLSGSAMVYSSAANRFILFGGLVGLSDNYIYTGKTWSYDFNTNTWTDVTPNH